MSPALPSDLASFVEQQVSSGQYGSADEVVVAGLRALKARQERLDRLKALIQEGIDAEEKEEFIDLDTEEDYERLRQDITHEGMKLLADRRAAAHGATTT